MPLRDVVLDRTDEPAMSVYQSLNVVASATALAPRAQYRLALRSLLGSRGCAPARAALGGPGRDFTACSVSSLEADRAYSYGSVVLPVLCW